MSRVQAAIRKVLPPLVAAAIVVGGVWALFLRPGAGPEVPTYTVEIDNAFGLTEGAQVRAAGVEVGAVKKLRVDRKTARALVDVTIERTDFGDLRTDATCSIEPQSLIGEYFLDCEPGKAKKLKEGGTIPAEQTTGTIPPDLVQSVMRRPQREQLGIIISELGAGFTSRGPELQAVIQRAIPALRETDAVLELLADNERTLTRLTVDADQVLARLSTNRRDIRRFVTEARDTATISANRRRELAETIRRLPRFLQELRPTLDDLETVADKQTPALMDLRASADDLEDLLARLGPFADAATPAIDALGEASQLGTQAVAPARATVAKTRQLAQRAKEPSTNLRFVLEHIDDRKNAVEKSPVSPTGQGFTGLEAFLRYPFVQSQALNLFDSRGYTLKLNALINECSGYTNAETAKRTPERTKKCNSWLGPNQPGVTTPDPSGPATARATRARKSSAKARKRTKARARRAAPKQRAPRQQGTEEQ
ncbi:MAG TPA: MlaD family protein, partial [Solirubrobacteraceae bacterium]|nr:MlaD family protein [Solirubrobacteraceae bacterium]